MREWRRHIVDRFREQGHVVDGDVAEELAQHAAAAYEAARAEGLAGEAARARVDVMIDSWVVQGARLRRTAPRRPPAVHPPAHALSASWTAGLGNDLRYAARLIRRQPRFALVVVLTMALGIAATTSLFSVVYGVLVKPLPWPGAERLVVLKETRGGQRPRFGSLSNQTYLAWQGHSTALEGIAAWAARTVTLAGAGDPERVRVATVTASLFPVLGVSPIVGTLFTASDETAGGVLLLSEGLWRQRFGGDPSAVGRTLHVEGKPHRVVGVLPAAGSFPDADTRAWIPLAVPPPQTGMLSLFEAVARLRPGVGPAEAAAEGTGRGLSTSVSANLSMVVAAIFGADGPIAVTAVPLREALTSDVRRPLIVLLVAVGLLFATAVANIASLQLAQATTRRREMAIRSALGAGHARATRQMAAESGLLALAGGAAGVFLTVLLHRAVPWLLPADFPRMRDLSVDAPVIGFAVSLSCLAACGFGLLPAFRLRRVNLAVDLTEDGMAPAGARGRTRTARARLVIMAGQVAIACVLLVGASLLGRSFVALLDADLGFDPSNVLTARVQMPAFAYPPERRAELADAILARLRSIPGVTAASFSDVGPLAVSGVTAFTMDAQRVQAGIRMVTPGYFAAAGMRLVDGRDFTDADVSGLRRVFVVNRAFARQYLGGAALGRRVRAWIGHGAPTAPGGAADAPPLWEVIGVVDDVRHRGAREAAEPEVYQYPTVHDRFTAAPTFLVRTAGDPTPLIPTFRAVARQQDAGLAVDAIGTMESRVLTGLAQPRLYAVLLAGFAVLALLIAGVGLLAVLSYAVSQRSRELAVRAALGARPVQLIRLVVAQGVAVTAAGLAIGLPAATILARGIARLLYGVQPVDPLTFAAVPLVLLAAALLACVPPALRAARADPLRVLRAP